MFCTRIIVMIYVVEDLEFFFYSVSFTHYLEFRVRLKDYTKENCNLPENTSTILAAPCRC